MPPVGRGRSGGSGRYISAEKEREKSLIWGLLQKKGRFENGPFRGNGPFGKGPWWKCTNGCKKKRIVRLLVRLACPVPSLTSLPCYCRGFVPCGRWDARNYRNSHFLSHVTTHDHNGFQHCIDFELLRKTFSKFHNLQYFVWGSVIDELSWYQR